MDYIPTFVVRTSFNIYVFIILTEIILMLATMYTFCLSLYSFFLQHANALLIATTKWNTKSRNVFPIFRLCAYLMKDIQEPCHSYEIIYVLLLLCIPSTKNKRGTKPNEMQTKKHWKTEREGQRNTEKLNVKVKETLKNWTWRLKHKLFEI